MSFQETHSKIVKTEKFNIENVFLLFHCSIFWESSFFRKKLIKVRPLKPIVSWKSFCNTKLFQFLFFTQLLMFPVIIKRLFLTDLDEMPPSTLSSCIVNIKHFQRVCLFSFLLLPACCCFVKRYHCWLLVSCYYYNIMTIPRSRTTLQ